MAITSKAAIMFFPPRFQIISKPIWYTAKVTTHATANWKIAVKLIQAQLLDSLRMVASEAAQGM